MVMQLPNWVEAAVTFWGAAYAGAIVVPVVHFYGAKELGHVLRTTQPSLLVTPDKFGSLDYGHVSELAGQMAIPWAVVVEADSTLPDRAIRFDGLLDAEPLQSPFLLIQTNQRSSRSRPEPLAHRKA